jgi:hypothetical protein
MRSELRLAAALLATVALALIASTAAVAVNPQATYTCTKTKPNGDVVTVTVPESAVDGLTNAGFVCVKNEPPAEGPGDEGPGDEGPGDEGPGDEGPGDEGPGDEGPGDEGPGDETPGEEDPGAPEHPQGGSNASASIVTVETPSESRSLYCSDGSGVALNLYDSQGALLVAKGLATPAIFYSGVGVSCDVLPGFRYSGSWVDHVGNVVQGVAVYPLFVPTTS